MTEPYNPLAKTNLADSIEREILKMPLVSMKDLQRFEGAGVYALYYSGTLEIYKPLLESLATESARPIYVGKAIPEGGRIGGLRGPDAGPTYALFNRLKKHAGKIDLANNISSADFKVRYLVVDDVWIPLGENALIETFSPLWNKVVSGFGNNPLGAGRTQQKPSLWDVLHPQDGIDPSRQPVTREEILRRVQGHLGGRAVPQEDYRDPFDEDSDGQ